MPSAALSVPDADAGAPLARGSTTVKVALDCGWDGTATSYNVIGEITGRSLPKEVVVIGGHLIRGTWAPALSMTARAWASPWLQAT